MSDKDTEAGSNPSSNEGPSSPNWYVLLHGLAAPRVAMTLAPGLTLVPLPEPLTIFDLAAAGGAGFTTWALAGQVASGCTCEIESARDSDVTPGYDTLNRAWLASALLVLRGFGAVMPIACSAYPWSIVAAPHKQKSESFRSALRERGLERVYYRPDGSLPQFTGQLLDFHAHMIHSDLQCAPPTESDASWCRAHFGRFNTLCAESARFRFALEAAIDWRYSKDHRTAIARLWSGIESLFGITAELVYRLSVYAASLLYPRGTQRTEAYGRIKGLYGVRSRAVHGEPLKDEQLTRAMVESFELLRSLLMLCIDRGTVPTDVELNRAVFE